MESYLFLLVASCSFSPLLTGPADTTVKKTICALLETDLFSNRSTTCPKVFGFWSLIDTTMSTDNPEWNTNSTQSWFEETLDSSCFNQYLYHPALQQMLSRATDCPIACNSLVCLQASEPPSASPVGVHDVH